MSQSFTSSKAFFIFSVVVGLSLSVSITIVLGLAIGFTLTCFTSIDLGIATICGLLAIGITIWSFAQIVMGIDRVRTDLEEDLTDEEVDSDVLTEDQVDAIAERLSEAISMRFSIPQTRTRRSSGRIR